MNLLYDSRYSTVDELVGKIYHAAIQNCVEIATNRQGCRMLQKCILYLNDDQRNRIMTQISSSAFVLAQDRFGNYLVQFLLETNLSWVTAAVLNELKGNYAYLSMQKHSSAVVEKCLLYAKEDDILRIIQEIMEYPFFLRILHDAFGNHVIQKILIQCKFLVDAGVQIATNAKCSCVLCTLHKIDDKRNMLMYRISSHASVLAQDQYGNYLVQFLLGENLVWLTAAVLNKLKGKYAYLSMQKHSSAVVEKCLLYAEEDDFAEIIQEIMAHPLFLHILQDAYGNYVIQRALIKCKGGLRADLVNAIMFHATVLRNHPFGKKVLLSIGSRKY